MDYLISPRNELLQFILKQKEELISNDKDFKLLSNCEELMNSILEVNKEPNENIFKFIYSFKTVIHSSILYEEEKNINTNILYLKKQFDEFYYLDRLIMDKVEMFNYEYNYNFIKTINEFFKLNNNNYSSLQKIVTSKILLDTINNYSDNNNNIEANNEEDINNIKKEIDNIINDNISIFKELNLDINEDNIKSIKNDEIYCDIIISLIKHNKFGNYNYLNSLMSEMDLEHINIGTIILTPLLEILDEKNNYIKQYLIKSKNDLKNETKINFYYILFKFILKSPILMYQITFLVETRNRILNMVKIKNISYNNLNNDIMERLIYVLERFVDSDYYLRKIDIREKMKLEEILKYYKLYFFESKKKEIGIIQKQIKNYNIKSEYLKDYEPAVQANNFYPIIEKIYYIANNEKIDSEKNLNKNFKNWEDIYKMIKNHSYENLKRKELIYKLMIDENNQDIFSKIFTKDEISSFINHIKEIEKTNNCFNKQEKSIINSKNKINNNSISFSTLNSENKSNEKNNEESLFEMFGKPKLDFNYNLLGTNMLKKCLIYFSVIKEDDKNKLEIDDVFIGNYNKKANIDKFKHFIIFFNQTLTQKEENFKRFAKFVVEFLQRIKDGFTNNYKLEMKFGLKNIQQDDNVDSIYHIDALYTFYKPYTNKIKLFSIGEENVLVNGINSREFNYMMNFINHEKFRNPKDEYYSNSLYKKFAEGIFNKCVIVFKVVVNNYFSLSSITIKAVIIGDNKEEIEITEFKKFLEFAKDLENKDEIIFKNIYKITRFIKNFQEKILDKFVDENNFHLILVLTNNNQKNVNNIYVIDASLEYINSSTYGRSYYEEKNILVKDKNSIFSEFFNQDI